MKRKYIQLDMFPQIPIKTKEAKQGKREKKSSKIVKFPEIDIAVRKRFKML